MHEIHGSSPNVMQISIFGFPCMYQYVLSTYSVQDYAHGIPRLGDVEVLRLGLLWSTSSVHTWYGTLLHWYTTCYSTVPLVLRCTGTYRLVMHVTILRISSFRFGTQYIQICTALIPVHQQQRKAIGYSSKTRGCVEKVV